MLHSNTTRRVLYHPLDPNAFCVLPRGASLAPLFSQKQRRILVAEPDHVCPNVFRLDLLVTRALPRE